MTGFRLVSLLIGSKLLFAFACSIEAAEFSNTYNHFHGSSIKRFTVFGERCTGTHFISSLIQKNFPELQLTNEYGTKHFPWWFDLAPDDEKLFLMGYTKAQVTLTDSDDCLFIVIVRDPYDWLRSFFLMPHHVHQDLLYQGFYHFISQPWKTPLDTKPFFNFVDAFHPLHHRPFQHVLELRTQKIRNYLKMGALVKNYLFVRFEDVSKDPEGFIQFVSVFYKMKSHCSFISITTYKGLEDRETYQPKAYFPIDDQSLTFINEELDWETENLIGYEQRVPKEKSWLYFIYKRITLKLRKILH